jgi:hypothetical protein
VALPDLVQEVEGLPPFLPPEEGIFFIVSALVGAHMSVRGRGDVLVPGTGPRDGAIRDNKGHIVAVTRLKAV